MSAFRVKKYKYSYVQFRKKGHLIKYAHSNLNRVLLIRGNILPPKASIKAASEALLLNEQLKINAFCPEWSNTLRPY